MQKKTFFGLIIMFIFIIISGTGYGANPSDWSYCGLKENEINNRPELSRDYNKLINEFNKWNRRASPNKKWKYEQRSPSYPIRPNCNNKTRFNNGIGSEIYSQQYQNFKKRFINIPWDKIKNKKQSEIFKLGNQTKTETQCFQDFIKYARDEESYKKSIVKRGDNRWTNALKSNGINSTGDLLNKIKQLNFNSIPPNSIDYKDVWLLQGAINVLGCDKIMMDGKLGNYTIKSFCVCGTEPPKPKLSCINVKETKLGEFTNDKGIIISNNKIKKNISLDNIIFTGNESCNINTNNINKEIFNENLNNYFSCEGSIKGHGPNPGSIPICCPTDIKPHNIKVENEDIISCCVDPNKEGLIITPQDAIMCGPNTEIKSGKIKGTEVLICPCDNGKDRVKTKGKWECKELTCNDIPNIEKDCKNFEKKDGATMPKECEYNGKTININNCYPCKDGKLAEYHNNKRMCDDCPKGEKKDRNKDKCVCDPAQQCCGIKLNTNVPWIGRCIEFGATNNTNKTVTNEYGDGNTTTTVNILNAFPVLMSSLGKILLSLFFLIDFGMLIYAGTLIASGEYDDGKKRIQRVAIGIALVGASGIILHAINPNFFL